jgi:1-acyl-sn-glycerol-3-phosphate acyltransferase
MREELIGGILEFLAGHDHLTLVDIRGALERAIGEAGPDALVALRERLTLDVGWAYYSRDPLARHIHHLLADRFLQHDSAIVGRQYLDVVGASPVAIFANHVSYADANVIEVLLQRFGGEGLANRLTAIARPKVFTSPRRRFSSLCFGTITVPQSAEVSSEEAILNPREVARADQSIQVAHKRLISGDALLLFGEGTRSRSGSMQPMLAAVARYLEVADAWVMPAGLTGSEALFPLGGATVYSSRVGMRLGQPFRAEALLARANGDRRLAMDAIGLAVADVLPAAYRGVYGADSGLSHARRVLDDVRHAA